VYEVCKETSDYNKNLIRCLDFKAWTHVLMLISVAVVD
jgi:hypothetical protein